MGLHTKSEIPSSYPFEFTYNDEGYLQKIKTPDIRTAGQHSATFTLAPNTSAVINEFGGRTVTLNGGGQFVGSITDPAGLPSRTFTPGTQDRTGTQSWDGTSAAFVYSDFGTVSNVNVGGLSQFVFTPMNSVALTSYSVVPDNQLKAKQVLPVPTTTLGNRVEYFTVDSSSRILTHDRADGVQLKWERDGNLQLDKFTDGRGIVHDYGFNGRGLLETEVHPDRGTQTYGYDGNDLLTNYTWPQLTASISLAYQYYANQLTQAVQGWFTSNLSMTLTGLDVETVTDERGYKHTYTYDTFGRVLTHTVYLYTLIPVTTETYQYDSNGNVDKIIDAKGGVWDKLYDANNRLIREDSPLGATSTTEYKAYGPVKKTTSPTNSISEFIYNASGLLQQSVLAQGTTDQQTTSYTYHATQLVHTKTDPTGFVTTTIPVDSWQSRSIKTSQIVQEYAGSREFWTKTTSDGNGNVTLVQDDLGDTVVTTYDDANRPKKIRTIPSPTFNPNWIDPKIVVKKLTYENDGLVKTEEIGKENLDETNYVALQVTTNDYNNKRQLIKQTVGNDVTEFGYDGSGNVNYTKSPMGLITHTLYNQFNLPMSVTQQDVSGRGQGQTLANVIEYDLNQNKIREFAPRQNGSGATLISSTYEYDQDNRLVRVNPPNPVTGVAVGTSLPSAFINQPLPASSSPYSTIYEYWPDNQLKKETSPVHNASGSRHSVSYEYDKLGRVRKAEDELGVTETQYFTQQRKTIVKDPLLNETETITDELGRTKMVTAPNPSVSRCGGDSRTARYTIPIQSTE